MYPFFVALYLSVIRGRWFEPNESFTWNLYNSTNSLINNIFTFIMNALGGNFSTVESFDMLNGISINTDPTIPATLAIAMVLGFLTTIGICVAVWKITKALFAVFFRGAR